MANNNQMVTLLQEVNVLFKDYEETKNANKELSEFNAVLQEELQLARDKERSAESKKARCQTFLNQQQEIINRLLAVKEENENLKCKLNQTETSLAMVQNNSIDEQMRNEVKIQKIEKECLQKLTKVQEEADQQAEKEKSELRASVSQLEEKLEEQDAVIMSLNEELQNLRVWSSANIETFQKKLADQERKHQSELETWKMAELNRSAIDQGQQNNPITLYGSNQNYWNHYQAPHVLGPMQGYQPNVRFQGPTASYQKPPLVTRTKNVPPSHNTNMVRPLAASQNYQDKSNFISANDLHMQNHMLADSSRVENSENGEDAVKENRQVVVKKSKILVPNKKRKLFSGNQNML